MKTFKEKLQAVLREELAQSGPAFGWFPAADGSGAYLMRQDGQLVGVGLYQQTRPFDGVKKVEDLDITELAALMGYLVPLSQAQKKTPDLLVHDVFVSGDMMAWARSERDDFRQGAIIHSSWLGAPEKPSSWDTKDPQPATLISDTRLLLNVRHSLTDQVSLPAGTPLLAYWLDPVSDRALFSGFHGINDRNQVMACANCNGEDYYFTISNDLLAFTPKPKAGPSP